MSNRGKNWCFTLNNYSSDEFEILTSVVDTINDCNYVIFGKEVGESGTPHLQGFIAFEKRKYLSELKKKISDRAHFELAKYVPESIEYCKKDGDFYEFGAKPVSSQGKRTDLDAFKQDVKEGMLDFKEIRERHSLIYAKYKNFVQEYVMDNSPKRNIPSYALHEWQLELLEKLQADPDDRTVTFIVDQSGNNGKTWFAHWFTANNPDSQVMTPGKRADMAYTLRTDIRVLFLDAPRSKQGDFIQYDFLEDVKNGFVFSPKYESITKTLKSPHVVVLMNEPPDITKLSADRFDITYL